MTHLATARSLRAWTAASLAGVVPAASFARVALSIMRGRDCCRVGIWPLTKVAMEAMQYKPMQRSAATL